MAQWNHPDNPNPDGEGGRTIHPNEKLTILNEANVIFDLSDSLIAIGDPGTNSIIYSKDFAQTPPPGQFVSGEIYITGGSILGYASNPHADYGIFIYENYPADITLENTNFILNNFNIGIYAKNGSVLFDNDTKKVSINNAKTGIKALNKAKISFNNGNFELTNVSTGVYATQQSEIKLSNVNTTLTNVDCFVYSTDNSDISLQGKVVSRQNANQYFINAVGGSKVLAKFKNADIKTGTFVYSGSDASVNINSSSILADSINFAYAQDNSLINININNFIATGTEFFAGASENSNIILTATDSAKISGLLIADAINAFSDQNQKASVELNLGVSESNSFVRNSNNFIFNGDAITANKGTINSRIAVI